MHIENVMNIEADICPQHMHVLIKACGYHQYAVYILCVAGDIS